MFTLHVAFVLQNTHIAAFTLHVAGTLPESLYCRYIYADVFTVHIAHTLRNSAFAAFTL